MEHIIRKITKKLKFFTSAICLLNLKIKKEETTRKKAVKIARGPLKAFALAKENLNQAFAGMLESQLEKERLGIMKAARTQDAAEGVTAVLEKRKPNFIGS